MHSGILSDSKSGVLPLHHAPVTAGKAAGMNFNISGGTNKYSKNIQVN